MGFTVLATDDTAIPTEFLSNVSHATALAFAEVLDVIQSSAWTNEPAFGGVHISPDVTPLTHALRQGYNGVTLSLEQCCRVHLGLRRTREFLATLSLATVTELGAALWPIPSFAEAFAYAVGHCGTVVLD